MYSAETFAKSGRIRAVKYLPAYVQSYIKSTLQFLGEKYKC